MAKTYNTLGTVAPGDVLRANSGTASYNGVITNVNNYRVPAMCRAERAASQNIANGVAAAINFDTENFDTDGMFAATANYITINTAGIYIVTGLMSFSANATGVRSVGIVLNPVFSGSGDTATISSSDRRIAHADATSVGSGAEQTLACSTVFEFSASDTIALSPYQNSGGTRTTGATDKPALGVAWVGQVS